MNLADSIFIFGLALIIFGPKKLPEIGRQIGKIMLEFRRASNEFKMQIEEELRNVEQADRQKQFAETASKSSLPAAESSVPATEESAFPSSSTDSSESLTVRPPSTGITESAESPYQPVAAEPLTTEAVATELVSAEEPAAEPVSTAETAAGAPPVPASTEMDAAIDSRDATTAMPEPVASPVDLYQSAAYEDFQERATQENAPQERATQEQPTNHHG